MKTRPCQCCGAEFEPCPQVPNQLFCSKPECQRDRRRRWQQQKLKTDPAYQENQSHAQRAWLDRHPDYWRSYRQKQHELNSNQPQQQSTCVDFVPAKMDESSCIAPLPAGIYSIKPIQSRSFDLPETWLVEITLLSVEPFCKKDEC